MPRLFNGRYPLLALLAAALFGLSAPISKRLLGQLSPLTLAGLLYLGSGVGLGAIHLLRRLRSGRGAPGSAGHFPARDVPWLAGAVICGGVAAPVMLLWGLSGERASTASFSGPATWMGAMLLGLASYGVSLVLYIVALRHLGAARCGAYFGTAPLLGAVFALAILGEPMTVLLLTALTLVVAAAWLIFGERHEHEHAHEPLEHSHRHKHDAHHKHAHDGSEGPEPHSHSHRHEPMTHSHPHLPDLHHWHEHG